MAYANPYIQPNHVSSVTIYSIPEQLTSTQVTTHIEILLYVIDIVNIQ